MVTGAAAWSVCVEENNKESEKITTWFFDYYEGRDNPQVALTVEIHDDDLVSAAKKADAIAKALLKQPWFLPSREQYV